MTNITRSEPQLTILRLGPSGARPETVLHPFLRPALHPGPPRDAVAVTPTPFPFVSPEEGFTYGSDNRPDGPTDDTILGQ